MNNCAFNLKNDIFYPKIKYSVNHANLLLSLLMQIAGLERVSTG